jgi:uncharacterized alpha-E superfamily protein
MGRYIERADHLARYSKANYFSSLDAPILKTHDRTFVLESMLYMAGIFDMEEIKESDVLFRIGLIPKIQIQLSATSLLPAKMPVVREM